MPFRISPMVMTLRCINSSGVETIQSATEREGRLCLDLGYKAVASDPAGPRARLLDLDDGRPIGHSEEHLVIETARADRFPIGTAMLAIPTHICPTVALHRRAYVIEDGELVGQWEVTARDRVLGI